MPVVKGSQPLPPRPVIMVLFGEPGATKTSIANTCDTPLLIDADKGASRSHHRGDTLQLDSWDEVLTEEAAGTFRNYKTIVIDTAKAVLDDFLTTHVIKKDYKLKANKLGMFGAIGDEFKLFVNNRRTDKADLIIVCHAKREEDTKRTIPDVTGGSYQLLMRIADQVGYVSIINGQRVISFEPTETKVGKNVACLPDMIVPGKDSTEFKTFGAQLIEKVRTAIATMSAEQTKALELSQQLQDRINACPAPYDLNGLVVEVNGQPEFIKAPLRKLIAAKAEAMGWVYDQGMKAFVVPAAPSETPSAAPASNPAPAAAAPVTIEAPAPAANVAPAGQPAFTNEEYENMVKETAQTEATIKEEIPKGVAAFKKSYQHPETLELVLSNVRKIEDLANLFFQNGALIEKTPGMNVKFTDKKAQLNGAAVAV